MIEHFLIPCVVYLLKCNDGSYYVGHTTDLEERLKLHSAGQEHGYTSSRLPISLVYVKEFETRDEAFWLERQIKGWSRRKKEALINGDIDLLKEFASRAIL